MTRYPPGFFLDPQNWWALPQSLDLPAYPWTPSREIAQAITGDDGSMPTEGNVARGLVDFDRFGSPPIGTLNMWPQSALLGVPPMSGGVGNAAAIPQFTLGRAPFASRFQTMSPFGARTARRALPTGEIRDRQETFGNDDSRNAASRGVAFSSTQRSKISGALSADSGGRYEGGHTASDTVAFGLTRPDASDTSEEKGFTRVQQQPMNSDFARAMIGIIDATQVGILANGPAGQAAFANGSTYETNADGSHLVKEGTVFSVTPDGRGFATTGSPQNGTMVLVKPDGSVTLLRGPL